MATTLKKPQRAQLEKYSGYQFQKNLQLSFQNGMKR